MITQHFLEASVRYGLVILGAVAVINAIIVGLILSMDRHSDPLDREDPANGP